MSNQDEDLLISNDEDHTRRLVPLAVVIAWALAQDRKRRRRYHAHGADMQSRLRAARESANDRAARWM